MSDIRVVAVGALGRMGSTVARTVVAEQGLELVGGVDARAQSRVLEVGKVSVPLAANLRSLLAEVKPDVAVDFTHPSTVMDNIRTMIAAGVRPVVGTTGITPQNLEEIDKLAKEAKLGAVVAPNFALGAVLLMYLSQIVSRYMDAAEIIELHHDKKADAPSGTALSTARLMRASRGSDFRMPADELETLANVRGGAHGGIRIHSVRLPGFVAHQEVIFGGLGQTLTIRHDSTSHESFMPGVMMAVHRVPELQGLTFGLDALLGLK